MPQATVNPSGAAAPFDPSTAIAHFQFIEDASAFIQGKHAVVPRAHAVAFFASEREPESRIYERVAEMGKAQTEAITVSVMSPPGGPLAWEQGFPNDTPYLTAPYSF